MLVSILATLVAASNILGAAAVAQPVNVNVTSIILNSGAVNVTSLVDLQNPANLTESEIAASRAGFKESDARIVGFASYQNCAFRGMY